MLLKDFEQHYSNATPQGNGSYWSRISLNDRKISWQSPCSLIKHQAAAAGQFGIVVAIESELCLVRYLQASELEHHLPPGTIFKQDNHHIAVTCHDGICVIDKANIIEKRPLNSNA